MCGGMAFETNREEFRVAQCGETIQQSRTAEFLDAAVISTQSEETAIGRKLQPTFPVPRAKII